MDGTRDPITDSGPIITARILLRVGGQTWRITPDRSWRMGRAKDADIHLDDPLISRDHAILESTPEGWVLVNHGRNGMFVGGRRVERLVVQSPVSVMLGSPTDGVAVQLHPKLTSTGAAVRP